MKRIAVAMSLAVMIALMAPYASFAEEPAQEEQVDVYLENCTDDEYKVNCYELWYDDLIFGERKDVKDKFARLELFVEEIRHFTPIELTANVQLDLIVDEFDLIPELFSRGVKREPGSMSYVGEPIKVFFSNSIYNASSSGIREGDHLVVYGRIIECLHDYWNGVNSVYLMPRIVQNNGQ